MKTNDIKIAVSGISAAGKGTISRAFAISNGMSYVDVGMIFRFGTYCTTSKIFGGYMNLPHAYVNREWDFVWDGSEGFVLCKGKKIWNELMCPNITEMTAKVSAIPEYFSKFKEITELVLANKRDVIADGRSMGGLIMPNANYKFYITADSRVRAIRRQLDYSKMGLTIPLECVHNKLLERDELDRKRKLDPLIIPNDAFVIDTTIKCVDEVVSLMSQIVGKP